MASRIAEAGVLGARGNSGMMLSHYFLGFAEGLEGRDRAGPEDLATAMRRASNSLYQAVDQPIEGTILTVVREATEEVERFSLIVHGLEELARRWLGAARDSLKRTPDLLSVLREANVVDAGAKGFVCFVEGMVGLIDGDTTRPKQVPGAALEMRDVAAEVAFPEDGGRAFRFCSEFIVRGDPPEQRAMQEAVRELGGSLIVTRAHSVAKIHIHTDQPAEVERALAALGCSVECVKAEDMRAQHETRRRLAKRKLAVVTDSTCDLPPELIIEHDITVVPLTAIFGERSFLDQVDITHEEFLERLLDPDHPQPTTSQPSPAQLIEGYRRAAEHAGDVLGIFVGGALSGTLGQAQAAASRFEGAVVRVFDSRAASLGLGFQVLRAAELAEEGCGIEEIVGELERLRPRSGLFITVDTLTHLQRSGRVGKAKAFLGGLLDLKPVLSLDEEGFLVPAGHVRGSEALVPKVIELVRQSLPAEPGRLRMAVAHVGCEGMAEELAGIVGREFDADEVLVRPAANVIAAHLGPGAWGVFYQAQ